jgi:hypothetical protein
MAPDQLLTAPDGRPLARYQRRLADDDRPMADLVELVDGVEEAEAVPALMAAFAGWRVGAAPPLARALVAAGARTHRHAHVMSRDLRGDPAPAAWLEPQLPVGFRLTAVGDRRAGDLAPVAELAYPPGHPDHRPEPEVGELEAIMSGRLAAGTRDGVPAIGLAVTHANPARARYAALGFAEVIESLSVDV